MKLSRRSTVFSAIAGVVTVLSPSVAVAAPQPPQSSTDPLAVTVFQAHSALPSAASLDPEQLARLSVAGTSRASLVAPCRSGGRVLLHNSATRTADYETKQAPGVDPRAARWSVSIFVYGDGQSADTDLTRIIAAERHCRRRGFISQDGIVWSVRHVGGVSVTGSDWTGYRTRDAESTKGKQNPLRLTTIFWSRGNVLVEIQQLVPASLSPRMADVWLNDAGSLVLHALSRVG